MYKFVEGYRPADRVCSCAICGGKTWASDIKPLAQYTGRDGLKVCPDCVDIVDYGLVPYKVPAERPVPFTNYLLPPPGSTTDSVANYGYENYDPLSGAPFPPEE